MPRKRYAKPSEMGGFLIVLAIMGVKWKRGNLG